MDREEVTHVFLTLTAAAFALAILTCIFVYCASKFHHRRYHRRESAVSRKPHKLSHPAHHQTITVECVDEIYDYIDAPRNTDLISSTIQVNSLRHSFASTSPFSPV